MTVQTSWLVSPQQITTSAVTYYTAGAGQRATISQATATNTTAGAVTVTVYLVPSAGSAGDSTTILGAKSIAANTTVILSELIGHNIEPAGTIQALAGANASITLAVSGVIRT